MISGKKRTDDQIDALVSWRQRQLADIDADAERYRRYVNDHACGPESRIALQRWFDRATESIADDYQNQYRRLIEQEDEV